MEGFYEHGDELSSPTKGVHFLNQLNNHHFLNKYSSPWNSQLLIFKEDEICFVELANYSLFAMPCVSCLELKTILYRIDRCERKVFWGDQ